MDRRSFFKALGGGVVAYGLPHTRTIPHRRYRLPLGALSTQTKLLYLQLYKVGIIDIRTLARVFDIPYGTFVATQVVMGDP